MATIKADLRDWKLSRCVLVGDAGMLSANNLTELARGGGRYIIGTPLRRNDETSEALLARAGHYAEIADNLRVKEVVLGSGERRRRFVICHNPDEAARTKARREALLAELEEELSSLETPDEAHSKRICELISSRRYGRYLRKMRSGKPRIDRSTVRAAERTDGKWAVTSNDDTLTATDLALGYKQLLRVEAAWRQLKTGLSIRPVHHHLERRIRAHIAISIWALLLERVAELRCGDTWRNIRDDLKQIKLAELSTPHGPVWQVTDPRPDAVERLKKLGYEKPPPVVKVEV